MNLFTFGSNFNDTAFCVMGCLPKQDPSTLISLFVMKMLRTYSQSGGELVMMVVLYYANPPFDDTFVMTLYTGGCDDSELYYSEWNQM